ncbi:BnaC02g41750D [Brassica napus]|uniref:BnaC02g41750D protein n=1 Tax=Brassica napus TaxID=3708 RepID=A0A078HST8_BRANA|nr:BnaC02g41750D [Brassica napus]
MGKPERKAREKTFSSSSYFLRCFGISRKIHSHKPTLDDDAGQDRRRWFSRATKCRLKNCQIKTMPEKQNWTIEDDKQNLLRVVRQVTRKNVAAVEQKTKEVYKLYDVASFKKMSEQRDINPEPLTLSGYDMCYEQASTTTVRVGKLEPNKTVGSGSKREKSSRVDPVIGISIIVLTLMIMLMWGRLCAVLCTCTWCYFLPRLKRKRIGGGKAEGKDDLDLNSAAYKKKIVLDGFLVRRQRRVLM